MQDYLIYQFSDLDFYNLLSAMMELPENTNPIGRLKTPFILLGMH